MPSPQPSGKPITPRMEVLLELATLVHRHRANLPDGNPQKTRLEQAGVIVRELIDHERAAR